MGKHKATVATRCKNCSKQFLARPYKLLIGESKFCSRKCANSGSNNPNHTGQRLSNYENKKRSMKKFPEKFKARRALKFAVDSGKLKREPCFCGNPKSEGHHSDYSKPLEVTWLCRKHHIERAASNL